MAKQCILKHGSKQDKPFIRDVRHSCTGFDISYGSQAQAFRYASRAVAVNVLRALQVYGNFYIVEVTDEV